MTFGIGGAALLRRAVERLRFSKFRCVILAMAVTGWPVVTLAQAFTLAGQFDVSPTGAASYSIPIAVAPGTAGMIPALTVEYSSQGGDGILGIGWSLGGLPSIGRCAQTYAQDGVRGGVSYTLSDRYCLDGQRLMVISGSDGADGSEYRTEIEGFSRIIAHGAAGNGPAWFEVHSKSGQVMEFGNTADSQILAVGKPTVRVWAVDKITDTKGNYLSVTYSPDTANGQAYPSRIDYTGNAAAGRAPYNSVQFVYETRPDAATLYQAGSPIKTAQRLTHIEAYAGMTLVNDYQFAYQLSAATKRSQLISVTQCVGTGECLPPTTFTWQTNPATGIFTGQAYAGGFTTPMVGDFNGDGKADIISNQLYSSLSNGNGTFASAQQIPAVCSGAGINVVGDFNGDGNADILCVPDLQNNYYVLLGNGDGSFVEVANYLPGNVLFDHSQWTSVVGDFVGNGRTDFLLYNGSQYYRFMANGDGTFTIVANTFPNNWNFGNPGSFQVLSGDLIGGGKTDFLLYNGNAYYLFLSNGDGTFTATANTFPNGWSFGASAWTPVVGDFNGDGKIDFLLSNGTSFYVFLSKGDGTFAATASTYPNEWNFAATQWTPVAGDFNGDGKTDYLLYNGASYYTFISNGDGTFMSQVNTFPGDWNFGVQGASTPISGDFVGNGNTDFLIAGIGDQYYAFLANAPADLISALTTGVGASTAITYQPLPKNGKIYAKYSIMGYPTQELDAPLYVISQIDASNGVGSYYSSTYSYAGARTDLNGRGFLGFHQMTVIDLQTNIQQVSTYHQDFPYIGLLASRTKSLGSQTLNQTANTYGASPLGGTRNFVSLQSKVESSWDLDGSAMPAVTTAYQYDGYGNPTQVVVSTPDGASQTTSNAYSNDTSNWYLGRLTAASVTSAVPGANTPPPPPPPAKPVITVTYGASDNSGRNVFYDAQNSAYASPVWDGGAQITLNIVVNVGVILGAPNTNTYALIIPSDGFTYGSTINLNNNGYIVGAGGAGANAAISGVPGSNGGNALFVGSVVNLTGPVNVTNSGAIWGGGGGGGGGSGPWDDGTLPGNPGGGGAGAIPGSGGGGGQVGYGYEPSGQPGTLTTGGASGGGTSAGQAGVNSQMEAAGGGGGGGNVGQWGGNGGGTNDGGYGWGTGGSPGYYIVGNGNVTWKASGDLRGGAQ